ncbi:extensin family protein [Tepidamorphus sp. 3E244]|uniref:extensin-like domain-containing protein n=1 Tax=Tepidamorphus sp. 3E244 TaxID=3385498 RepID=UPI0038FC6BD9
MDTVVEDYGPVRSVRRKRSTTRSTNLKNEDVSMPRANPRRDTEKPAAKTKVSDKPEPAESELKEEIAAPEPKPEPERVKTGKPEIPPANPRRDTQGKTEPAPSAEADDEAAEPIGQQDQVPAPEPAPEPMRVKTGKPEIPPRANPRRQEEAEAAEPAQPEDAPEPDAQAPDATKPAATESDPAQPAEMQAPPPAPVMREFKSVPKSGAETEAKVPASEARQEPAAPAPEPQTKLRDEKVALPRANPRRTGDADSENVGAPATGNEDDTVADAKGQGEICAGRLKDLAVAYTVMPPIVEGRCGREDVLLVTAVGTDTAVPLASPATFSCDMAVAMSRWIGESVQPAAKKYLKTELKELPPGTSYSCRNRNHQPNAKLSEHGLANAFDVMGFRFTNGESVLVRDHSGSTPTDKFLTEIREDACGPFGTVLGPGTDEFHYNHFHFDAHERNNPYCR